MAVDRQGGGIVEFSNKSDQVRLYLHVLHMCESTGSIDGRLLENSCKGVMKVRSDSVLTLAILVSGVRCQEAR